MNTTPSNDFSRTGAFTRLAFTLKRVFFPVTMINGVSGLIFLSQQVFGSFNEYKGLAKEIGFLNDFFKILLYLEAINTPLAMHCTVLLNPQQIKPVPCSMLAAEVPLLLEPGLLVQRVRAQNKIRSLQIAWKVRLRI